MAFILVPFWPDLLSFFVAFWGGFSLIYLTLLRGTIVNRTYGIHKNLYINHLYLQYLVLLTMAPRNSMERRFFLLLGIDPLLSLRSRIYLFHLYRKMRFSVGTDDIRYWDKILDGPYDITLVNIKNQEGRLYFLLKRSTLKSA